MDDRLRNNVSPMNNSYLYINLSISGTVLLIQSATDHFINLLDKVETENFRVRHPACRVRLGFKLRVKETWANQLKLATQRAG